MEARGKRNLGKTSPLGQGGGPFLKPQRFEVASLQDCCIAHLQGLLSPPHAE